MIKQKLKTWFFIVAVFFSQLSNASTVDSLKQLLSEANDTERKIDLYLLLSKQFRLSDSEEAKSFSKKALSLSLNTKTVHALGNIYALLGDIAVMQDSLILAKGYYTESIKYFNVEENEYRMVAITQVLGNIALTFNDLSTAMHYYHQSVDYALKTNHMIRLPSLYLNIGSIHLSSGRFVESQEYFTKALKGSQAAGDTLLAGEAYSHLGLTYLNFGDFEIAKDYFHKAIEHYKIFNANIRIAISYQSLAKVDQKEGHYANAIQNLEMAEQYLEKGNPNYAGPKQPHWSQNYVQLGVNYLMLGENATAFKFLKQGYGISKSSGQLLTSSLATQYLSMYWKNVGNIDSAFVFYQIYKSYADSILNEDNIRKLALLEANFTHEQALALASKEMEKEAAIHQRNLVILAITIIGLILVVIVLVLFLKLSNNRTKHSELEQQNLRNELEVRNKELTTHLMHQVKSNELVLNISKKIKNLYSNSKPENKALINEVIREIELDGTGDQWEEFEMRFQQVHTGFYKNLVKKFPDLTSNELRLCAFLRLNMNSKDISAITYQSTNSLTVARWRLRQKFGLEKEISLSAFLTQF